MKNNCNSTEIKPSLPPEKLPNNDKQPKIKQITNKDITSFPIRVKKEQLEKSVINDICIEFRKSYERIVREISPTISINDERDIYEESQRLLSQIQLHYNLSSSVLIEPVSPIRRMEDGEQQNIGIIVPYRNRRRNLKIWLNLMKIYLYLQKEKYNYYIFVIEHQPKHNFRISSKNFNLKFSDIHFNYMKYLQKYRLNNDDNLKYEFFDSLNNLGKDIQIELVEDIEKFNKGSVINSGVRLIENHFDNIDCLVVHDVDLIPNDLNSMQYKCEKTKFASVKHLSFSVQNYNSYQMLLGGVLCIWRKVFEQIDGYSNEFNGWGGEDDEMSMTIQQFNICIYRPSIDKQIKYQRLPHSQSPRNLGRWKLLRNPQRTRNRLSRTRFDFISQSRQDNYVHYLISF
ncbi:hypothetical protein SNEBB_001574 [Seison nebaliae]|nr:hypothetical protein SNEBB_001574 [Seison nebaliae]